MLVAALSGVWIILASPLLAGLATDRESIERSSRLLAHYHNQAAVEPDLERQRAMLLSQDNGKDFLQGADPSTVAAEIQTTARRLVVASGAIVRLSQTLPGADEGGFWRGEVAFEVQASAVALMRLLHMLASNRPVILIERLAVRTAEDRPGSAAINGETLLEIQLQLASYASFKSKEASLK